jgi:hypothetical protein
MQHATITHLLKELNKAGVSQNTVTAFSNVLERNGFEPQLTGSKQTPHHLSQLVEGIYRQNGLNTFTSLVHIKKNLKGDWIYLYLSSMNKPSGASYSQVLEQFLKQEEWTLHLEL